MLDDRPLLEVKDTLKWHSTNEWLNRGRKLSGQAPR